MIKLFNIKNYIIDTNRFENILHDQIVIDFENKFANHVGAKYACSVNSATNAIFLIFLNKNTTVTVPSMIPPVVLNGIVTSGNKVAFNDNIEWVGDSYILHKFENYKVIDSAQKVEKNQFKNEADPDDLMFFSFYPTKPVGGIDGGMIVSDDLEKITWFKHAVMNGMSNEKNNWERTIKFPGYKMYMNSIQAYVAQKNFDEIENKKQKLTFIRHYYNEKLNLKNKSDHLYRIDVDNNIEFLRHMKNENITCGIHYNIQHKNKVYTSENFNCPQSEAKNSKTASIPFHEDLEIKDLNFIINKINQYGKKK